MESNNVFKGYIELSNGDQLTGPWHAVAYSSEATSTAFASFEVKQTQAAILGYSSVFDDDEDPFSIMQDELKKVFPLLNKFYKCPCTPCANEAFSDDGKEYVHADIVGQLIVHLNDESGWTREQIAEWVDSL